MLYRSLGLGCKLEPWVIICSKNQEAEEKGHPGHDVPVVASQVPGWSVFSPDQVSLIPLLGRTACNANQPSSGLLLEEAVWGPEQGSTQGYKEGMGSPKEMPSAYQRLFYLLVPTAGPCLHPSLFSSHDSGLDWL